MTTMAKPRILATRKLPDEVEARLMRDFTVALNSEDRAMSSTEIAEKAKGFDPLSGNRAPRITCPPQGAPVPPPRGPCE